MTADEFVAKWRHAQDAPGRSTVGIVVHWDAISPEARAVEYSGAEAWERLHTFGSPWGEDVGGRAPYSEWFARTTGTTLFTDWAEGRRAKWAGDRANFCEKPFFCAFANKVTGKGVLGDGNHRFLVAKYLRALQEDREIEAAIDRCTLDVLYVGNLASVLQEHILPR